MQSSGTESRAYQSWGRYPRAQHTRVLPVYWRSEPPALTDLSESVLPFACGRSYGDSCLNAGGALLDVAGLDRFIGWDKASGVLRCEAGVTLAEILALVVPQGWFVPVLPGTQWVSVGGAIANDIHGKNHHRAGTFGAHVTCLELMRSTGERLICSMERNEELFRATIGGLGLTGLILWAEIRLKRIPGAAVATERIRFSGLNEFSQLSVQDQRHEYTVAWIDCLGRGRRLARGLYFRGDHAAGPAAPIKSAARQMRVPVELPSGLINRVTLAGFNTLYYRNQFRTTRRSLESYQSFFFPLDKLLDWNRLYGRRGFFQYQCVVPDEAEGAVADLLTQVARSKEVPSLAVLKRFGARRSPGMMSFPRPGTTLAIDFANRGAGTLALLDRLDSVVAEAGGAVYPAKDARMSSSNFRRFFPSWQSFAPHVDPKFSSSFWRRVTGD
jgi:FAD/FMN-containing dehydrogenase